MKGSQSWGESGRVEWDGLGVRSGADSKVGKLPFFKKRIITYYFWLRWVFVSGRAFFFLTMKQFVIIIICHFIF